MQSGSRPQMAERSVRCVVATGSAERPQAIGIQAVTLGGPPQLVERDQRVALIDDSPLEPRGGQAALQPELVTGLRDVSRGVAGEGMQDAQDVIKAGDAMPQGRSVGRVGGDEGVAKRE